MVEPTTMIAGETIGAVSKLGTGAMSAKAAQNIALINSRVEKKKAELQHKTALAQSAADKHNTIVNEADEIMSIIDRPCLRFTWQLGDLSLSGDLSIMSLMGLGAAADLLTQYKNKFQYVRRQREYYEQNATTHDINSLDARIQKFTPDTYQNTNMFQALAGVMQLGTDSIAEAVGATE